MEIPAKLSNYDSIFLAAIAALYVQMSVVGLSVGRSVGRSVGQSVGLSKKKAID